MSTRALTRRITGALTQADREAMAQQEEDARIAHEKAIEPLVSKLEERSLAKSSLVRIAAELQLANQSLEYARKDAITRLTVEAERARDSEATFYALTVDRDRLAIERDTYERLTMDLAPATDAEKWRAITGVTVARYAEIIESVRRDDRDQRAYIDALLACIAERDRVLADIANGVVEGTEAARVALACVNRAPPSRVDASDAAVAAAASLLLVQQPK